MALVGMVTKLPAAMDRQLQRDRSRNAVATPTATRDALVRRVRG